MSKVNDLTEMRFGRLTAVECIGSDTNKRKLWKCKCDCGTEIIASSNVLLMGRTQSCGCLRREVCAKVTSARAEEARVRRLIWADSMVDEHHAKFWADGYLYVVSDNGDVFGPSGKLAQTRDNKGYMRFKRKPVHRLVAKAFVPGYADGLEVDHINAVRHDNRKENLRWVTPEQNKVYARDSIIASNKARSKNVHANQR